MVSQTERLEWLGEEPRGPDNYSIFVVTPYPVSVQRNDVIQDSTTNVVNTSVTDLRRYFRPSAWTANLLALFNLVRIKRATLEWVPRCGSADRGNIIVSHLRDPLDVTGNSGSLSDDWASGRWTIAQLESTGSRSYSFPVWKSMRIDLPVSGEQDFYSPTVDIGSYQDGSLTVNAALRTAFTSGLWMCGVEGLAQVAAQPTADLPKLLDYGHFRISYNYECSEPISVGAVPSISPASVASVTAVSGNVLNMIHKMELGADGVVNRSALNPLYSPYKKVTNIDGASHYRVGLDLSKSGSDTAILLLEGCELLSMTGLSRLRVAENAWELSMESDARAAIFVKLRSEVVATLSLSPVD